MDFRNIELANDETCYFSALEDIEQDSSFEENYYTNLRLDDMSSRHYSSLKHLIDENIEDDLSSITDDLSALTANDSMISNMLQAEEYSLRLKSPVKKRSSFNSSFDQHRRHKEFDEGFDDDDYTSFLNLLEQDLIENFRKKIKNKKIKHFSLDQTIEEVFDELQYENALEDLIRAFAKSKMKKRSELISCSNLNSTPVDYSCYKKQETQNKSKCTQGTQTEPSDIEVSTKKTASRNKKESPLTNQVSSASSVQSALKEYPLLRHVFDMVKNSNLSDFYVLVIEYSQKLWKIVGNGSEMVKNVGKCFVSLIALDLPSLITNFVAIPIKDKWNVLKNLIYYSVKMTLVGISQVFISDSSDSFACILNSICIYVRNFDRIKL